MSLFENLLSACIMVIFISISAIALTPTLETSKVRATQLELKNVRTASAVFHLSVNRLPEDFRELCRARIMSECDDLDAFGNEYRWRGNEIRSAGIDGRYNNRDDIVIVL